MDRTAFLDFIAARTRAILQEFRQHQALQHGLLLAEDPEASPPPVGAVCPMTRNGVAAAQVVAVSYQSDGLGSLNDYLRIDEISASRAPVPGSDDTASFVDARALLELIASSAPPPGWSVLERARQGLMAELAAQLLREHVHPHVG